MNSPIQTAEATVTNQGNRAMSSIKIFLIPILLYQR